MNHDPNGILISFGATVYPIIDLTIKIIAGILLVYHFNTKSSLNFWKDKTLDTYFKLNEELEKQFLYSTKIIFRVSLMFCHGIINHKADQKSEELKIADKKIMAAVEKLDSEIAELSKKATIFTIENLFVRLSLSVGTQLYNGKLREIEKSMRSYLGRPSAIKIFEEAVKSKEFEKILERAASNKKRIEEEFDVIVDSIQELSIRGFSEKISKIRGEYHSEIEKALKKVR